ncbi:MAG: hypothetical protein ACXACH_00450, partial [Candidatus Hermodarchaeia archaeon]
MIPEKQRSQIITSLAVIIIGVITMSEFFPERSNLSLGNDGIDIRNRTSIAASLISGTWRIFKSNNTDVSYRQAISALENTPQSIIDERPDGILTSISIINWDAAPPGMVSQCGTILSDATWTGGGTVHTVTCNVIVSAGATLTIEQGAIVKFDSGMNLTVNGALRVEGSESDPVYFTSYRDDTIGGDTNGDGGSTGVRGDWDFIEFTDTSDDSVSLIDY